MNFIKENLKEVTTVDKVTDLVIFEKGSNVPKRIKKTTYDTNLGYKVYVALLNQSGTDAPIAKVLSNSLGANITWAYIDVGNYTGICTGVFTVDKTVIFTGQNYSNVGNECTFAYLNNVNSIYVETIDSDIPGNQNGILIDTFIEIRIYN